MNNTNAVSIPVLRKATPEDAETLCHLINGLAEYERLQHESHPDPEALRAHLQPDAQPRCEAVLAETEDGEAVGFALFFQTYSTFNTNWGVYLEDLFVEPAYRGQGIGFALLRHVAEVARERDCARLEWAVLDWNEPAIAFYRRLGAVSMDDWTVMRLTRDEIEAVATAKP